MTLTLWVALYFAVNIGLILLCRKIVDSAVDRQEQRVINIYYVMLTFIMLPLVIFTAVTFIGRKRS